VVRWKDKPESHDYPAAASYLSLLYDAAQVTKVVAGLHAATTVTFKAKDLLRASRLELLATDNPHVVKDLDKIDRGERLSPVLCVRGDAERDLPLVIADGYHRICASYHRDEDDDVPCRIVGI